MTINWDCDQLVFLAGALEEALPLQGTLRVITSKVPKRSFAGKVVQEDKEFRLYISLDEGMADSTINLALGYVLLYAYERENWDDLISNENLEAAHREVCSLLKSINGEFSEAVGELLDILMQWNKAESDRGSLKEDEFTAVCSVEDGYSPSYSLPVSNKDYGAN